MLVLIATGLVLVGQSLQRADAKGKKPPLPLPERGPDPEVLDPPDNVPVLLRTHADDPEREINVGSGDYRAHTQREWILSGAGTVSAISAAAIGQACSIDADCNDCDPCTLDLCNDSACVGGRRNGQGCTTDDFCEGVCDGGVGTGQACTTDFDCCGNGFEIPDGVCAFNPCVPFTTGGADGTGGRQCTNAVLPDGQFFTEGECNDGLECNGLETCDSATSTCVAGTPLVAFAPRCDAGANVGLACDPAADPGSECPPAIGEVDPGACVQTPFACEDLEQLCDEAENRCRVACITDEDCNDDGAACTLDRCDPKSCVGGVQSGQLCIFNADCDSGDCSGGGTGGCVVDPNPCGSVTGCSEGSICLGGDTPGATCIVDSDCGDVGGSCPPLGVCAGGANDGLACTGNAACPLGICTGNLSCRSGRCCVAGACSQVNREVCTSLGGSWRFVTNPCTEIAALSLNDCPSVGSGIAPPGNTVVNTAGLVVGPGALACGGGTSFERIGDDYKIGDGTGFTEVRIVRFNIDEITGTRLFIEFWDTTTDTMRPIFVQDNLTGGVGDGTNTFTFEPPLAIPKTGVVAISVARAFTDTGSFGWRSTGSSCFNPGGADDDDTCITDADCSDGGTCRPPVDVGDNDPNVMFVDGQLVDNFLGQCAGGTNDQAMCDFRAGDAGCPGGTCVDVPDVLRYELVTTDISEPLGGCCDASVGSCAQELPWVCVDQGNVFRGIGIGCAVCFGGNNVGFPCTTDVDCPGGGVCSESLCLADPQTACATDADCGLVGPCVAIAQCSAQACCNPDGSCTEVQGQGSSCPVGTTTLGFATGCSEFFVAGASPNACPQPAPFPGADNCRLVTVQEIPVGSDPNVPLTVTISGNNGDATFDDWFTGTCDGGARHGLSCDPEAADQSAECPVNPALAADTGSCERLCNSGSFDVFGGTQDPGWWDGFHISECANVRFDNCTTDPIVRGQWPQLYQASDVSCCAAINAVDGVPAPIGIGLEGDGAERGGPFCREDNLWWTHGLLAPGTYFMPIFSDDESEAHAATIVGGTGLNDYLLHVTVAPCAVAACCVNLCEGGTRAGEPCTANGVQDCPGVGARCSNGLCVGGTLDGFACSEACPGGGRCVEDSAGIRTCAGGTQDGSTCLTASIDLCPGGTCGARSCTETNEPMCGVMEGSFLAGANFPKNRCVGGANDGSECDLDVDCPDGACVVNDPIVSCTGAPCETGSCCIGDGACEDRDPNGIRLVRADCDAIGGDFTGGARCLGAPSPCPNCPLFSDPGKCMLHSGLVPAIPGNRLVSVSSAGGTNFADQSDRSNGFEVAQANDFIARGSLLTQFCFFEWRFGNVLDGCGSGVAERWIIKFYEDVDGVPGALLPDSPSTCPTNEQCDREQDWVTSSTHNLVSAASGMFGDNGFDLSWDYTLTLDPPIQLIPGERYWVEVSNDTGLPNCQTYIFMAHPDQDNDWKMEKYQPRDEYSVMSNNSTNPDTDGNGLSMCLDFADWDGQSIRPDTPTGSCCRCNGGVCSDDVEWRDCMFPLSAAEERNIGTLSLTPCALAGDCLDLGSGGSGCPGAPSGVEGEDCTFPKVVSDGNHLYNTACSSTDGIADYSAQGENGCDDTTPGLFLNDQWFEYHATCTGNVGFDLCENSTGSRTGTYDTMIAVFTDGSSVCPTFTRPVEPSGFQICEPAPIFMLGGQCEDNVCNAGSHLGVPTYGDVAVKDQCYLIRVGGEDDGDGLLTIGIAALEIFCDGFTCPPSDPVAIDQVVNAGGAKVDSVKNRYLSFTAGQPGREEGIRVKIIDAPAPFEAWAGSILWVGAPRQLSELSGKDDATPPTFTTASLECNAVDAAFIDWNAQGTIHVSGNGVIPGATYEIQVIDTNCAKDDPNSFPPERAVQLATGRWGDVAGQFRAADQTWTVPEGLVSIAFDVVSILDKFKNAPTAPIKSRTDIQPNPVDAKITIVDVTRALDAFGGAQFPFLPANPASPCPS